MAMGVMRLLWSLVAVWMIAMVTAGDEAALLAFKEQVSDSGARALASWNASWEGVKCSQWRPARVVALNLDGRALTGELSPAIGNLTFLRTLNLSFNSLHGEIPASLGRLQHLQRLNLNDNSFSGTFPVNLSSCVSMTEMGLHNNNLLGRKPAELGKKLMSLGNNSFTGSIPASLANLSHLQVLNLYNNQLVGSIPPGLGSIRSMRLFNLFGNNISGRIPPSLYYWSPLRAYGKLIVNERLLEALMTLSENLRKPWLLTLP